MTQKLKVADMNGFDPEELDVEWSDVEYETYDGDQPPTGTLLKGYVKKMWWTETSDETPMIKVLWVAANNTGKLEEFNGLPIWDQLVFKTSAAFRYGPFLQVVGLTLKQIHKNTYLADDDDSIGAPIEKIAKFEPGEDAEVSVITKRAKFKGEWKVEVGKYVDPSDTDDDDDDDEEDEEETPRRRKPAAKAASKPASRGGKSRKPVEEPEDDDDDEEDDDDADDDVEEDDDDDDDEPPAKPARRTASKSSSTARKPAAKTSTRRPATKTAGTRKRKADADDDPF